MDISSYYYYYYYYYDPNSIYNYPTQVSSNETYQAGNEELGVNSKASVLLCPDPAFGQGQLHAYNDLSYLCSEQEHATEEGEDVFKDPDAIPLPKDLTDMFKPLECELCGVQLLSETCAFTHYEGKVHIKNVNSYMKEHYNVYGSLQIKKERFVPVTCEICNVELTSNVVYQQHFSGKQHQKKLKKIEYSLPEPTAEDILTGSIDSSLKDFPPPPLPPILSDFVCEVCNITTNTEHQLMLHKNGQKHKRKLSKLKNSKLDNALTAFYNGEWPEEFQKEDYSTDTEALTCPPAACFVENLAMDCPLQFNDIQTTLHAGTCIENNEARGSNDNFICRTVNPVESNFIPSSLEPKTIPIDLDIKEEKLLSSTGIILQQLSILSNTVNTVNNEKNFTQDAHDLNNHVNSHSANEKENTELSPLEINNFTDTNELNEKQITNIPTGQSNIGEISHDPTNEIDPNIDHSKRIESDLEKVNKSDGGQSHESVYSTDPDNGKTHSQLDQEITKLAIEEIEKESTDFQKVRAFNMLPILENGNQLNDTHKCKFDKAGYRINVDIGKLTDSKNSNKQSNYEPIIKKKIKNSTRDNYNYRRNGNRTYSNKFGYREYKYYNWRSNDNFRLYNKYDNWYWSNYDDWYDDYESKSRRDREKRKRDRRHSRDEEHSRSCKSLRNYKDDKYNDRKHRSRSRSRKRKRSSRNTKRRTRSSSSESSYSEKSRSEYSDRTDEHSLTSKPKKKKEEVIKSRKTNKKKTVYEHSKRHRSESTSSSSSQSSKKSDDRHD